ncbi:GNAT family N-acetyltransferase [Gryllotalpicola koreensis]|uniref:GNAT family N-acetyltransferase n=2 Tax=Gryllotalpicola koreensis TaxID=993086 RepID=A0ABP8A8Z6_9MICO
MQPVLLTTTRLSLSVPTAADVEAMTGYCQDPDLTRYVPVPVPYTEDSARFFIEKLIPAGWASDNEYNWAIRAQNGEFAGMLGARRTAPDAASFDLGLWLGAPHRGRGYATEAALVVVAWLFDENVTSRLTWEAIVGNGASIQVARKLGFRFTGTRASAGEFRDGSHPPCWHAELDAADERGANADSWQALEPA